MKPSRGGCATCVPPTFTQAAFFALFQTRAARTEGCFSLAPKGVGPAAPCPWTRLGEHDAKGMAGSQSLSGSHAVQLGRLRLFLTALYLGPNASNSDPSSGESDPGPSDTDPCSGELGSELPRTRI